MYVSSNIWKQTFHRAPSERLGIGAEQDRNTERAARTSTKDATVEASSSSEGLKAPRPAFELVLAEYFPRVCETEARLWESDANPCERDLLR